MLDRWMDSPQAGLLLKGLLGVGFALGSVIVGGLAAACVMGLSPVDIRGSGGAGNVGVYFAIFLARLPPGRFVYSPSPRWEGPGLVDFDRHCRSRPVGGGDFKTKTILTSQSHVCPNTKAVPSTLPLGDDTQPIAIKKAFLKLALERNPHPGLKVLLARLEHPNRQVFVFRRRDWEDIVRRESAKRFLPHMSRRPSLGRTCDGNHPARLAHAPVEPAAITGGPNGPPSLQGKSAAGSAQPLHTRHGRRPDINTFNPDGVEVASCAHMFGGVAPFIPGSVSLVCVGGNWE